jgi:hypothetical protein
MSGGIYLIRIDKTDYASAGFFPEALSERCWSG